MAGKVKYWVKLDKNGRPVPGSNVNAFQKPTGGNWVEFTSAITCCSPAVTPR